MQDDLDLALAFMNILPPDPILLNTLLKVCIDRGDKTMLAAALQVCQPQLFRTISLTLHWLLYAPGFAGQMSLLRCLFWNETVIAISRSPLFHLV